MNINIKESTFDFIIKNFPLEIEGLDLVIKEEEEEMIACSFYRKNTYTITGELGGHEFLLECVSTTEDGMFSPKEVSYVLKYDDVLLIEYQVPRPKSWAERYGQSLERLHNHIFWAIKNKKKGGDS
jgi:hypothetical protein